MKCPHCESSDLMMTDRQGIEIDYCPKCRGVWLDRGELDKLIERSAAREASYGRRDDDRRRYDASRPNSHGQGQPSHYPQKRKSFWSELFD